jgi:hypothetical protein
MWGLCALTLTSRLQRDEHLRFFGFQVFSTCPLLPMHPVYNRTIPLDIELHIGNPLVLGRPRRVRPWLSVWRQMLSTLKARL